MVPMNTLTTQSHFGKIKHAMFACTLIGALWSLIAISMNFPTADVMMMNAVTPLFQTALLSGCKPLVNELNTTAAASSETERNFF